MLMGTNFNIKFKNNDDGGSSLLCARCYTKMRSMFFKNNFVLIVNSEMVPLFPQASLTPGLNSYDINDEDKGDDDRS